MSLFFIPLLRLLRLHLESVTVHHQIFCSSLRTALMDQIRKIPSFMDYRRLDPQLPSCPSYTRFLRRSSGSEMTSLTPPFDDVSKIKRFIQFLDKWKMRTWWRKSVICFCIFPVMTVTMIVCYCIVLHVSMPLFWYYYHLSYTCIGVDECGDTQLESVTVNVEHFTLILINCVSFSQARSDRLTCKGGDKRG